MTRRGVIVALAGMAGYLYGKPIQATPIQQQTGAPRGLSLPLDGVDGIVVSYRGQREVLTPQVIMAALAAKESE